MVLVATVQNWENRMKTEEKGPLKSTTITLNTDENSEWNVSRTFAERQLANDKERERNVKESDRERERKRERKVFSDDDAE